MRVVVVVALALACRPAPAAEPCETSTALTLDDGRILVGDNETRDRLFVYGWDQAGVHPASRFEVGWAGGPVEDIEALARDGIRIWVVGSHSRKKNLERDPGRLRILAGRLAGDRIEDSVVMQLEGMAADTAWDAAMRDASTCAERLFTEDARAGASVGAFCAALVDAEHHARQRSLNVEGAVVAGGRLWLGLRAPLAGAEQHAVLLRVRPSGASYRFDAVAFLALGGRGIRELATPVGQTGLWGIAGPVEDGSEGGFGLWKVDAAALRADAVLHPTAVETTTPLPASSEGLVLRPPHVLLWIDGDGKYPKPCKTPHRTAIVLTAPAP